MTSAAHKNIDTQGPRPAASLPGAGPRRWRVDGKFFRRGQQRMRIKGVTYGPFAPVSGDERFPSPERVAGDFALMRAAGINAIRTYHLPPTWLLDLAGLHGLSALIDVPWSKHLCFLDSERAQREARQAVVEAARRGLNHPALLACSIGNEVPPNVVRWHGARRVERFLAELFDAVKQVDADALVTYANFPSTEYLDLSFLDFATFNVYLHDEGAFCRYLLRLQNLVGDRPLLLGELGMDTMRHGEVEQSQFLAGHLRHAMLMGLAGAFVFSWTDDWHTGGQPVRDWAFGITGADRQPKPAYRALHHVFAATPTELLGHGARVSIVVCSFNGGRTLEQCVRSLLAIDYPDFEIIVVDDGSTDDTRTILSALLSALPPVNGPGERPLLRIIQQENQGLSAARNAGMQAATGDIIAYTDADCFADADWLTHLVYHFQRCDAAAVGGPNLSPDDGRLAGCVAAAPGQPTHVLVSDQEAEHIPGCNMAFRREALLAIRGFDPLFRKAGDDVDVCWRLQQAGRWITFAPGAFVWHHRRQGPRAYFRQQAGYGEAEALLWFKHPDRFNSRGDGKWNGVLYGGAQRGLRVSGPIIYRGTFATGLFQCLYQPAPAHWAALPSTLEWHAAAAALALAALVWPLAWAGVGVMLLLSLTVAAVQASQARLAVAHASGTSRLLVAWLCYAQPLVRSWWRYRTRLFSHRAPLVRVAHAGNGLQRLPLTGKFLGVYWSEQGVERLQLLDSVIQCLNEHHWGKTLDSGWDDWDLEICCHPWTVVQISTAEENHGDRKILIRVRFRVRPSGYWNLLALAGVAATGVGCAFWSWPIAAAAAVAFAACAGLWCLGTKRASQAVALFDDWADRFGLHRCGEAAAPVESAPWPRGPIRRMLGWLGRRLHRKQRDIDGALERLAVTEPPAAGAPNLAEGLVVATKSLPGGGAVTEGPS
jgi:O-antigen biosynthesis protein